MHDHVSKAGQFVPGDLRLGGLDVNGQALTRFGQRLQVADHRILNQTRRDVSKRVRSPPVYSRTRAMHSRMCVSSTRSLPGPGVDVHMSAQQFLRVQQQPTQSEATRAGRQGHQQIDIAVIARIVAGHRAEHTHARDATTACQRQKLLAVGFDQGMHAVSVGDGPSIPKEGVARKGPLPAGLSPA